MKAPKLCLNQRQADELTAAFPHHAEYIVVLTPVDCEKDEWLRSINSRLSNLETGLEISRRKICLRGKQGVSSEA